MFHYLIPASILFLTFVAALFFYFSAAPTQVSRPNTLTSRVEQNIQKARSLAVTLAFAIISAKKKPSAQTIELIKKWAISALSIPQSSKKQKRLFERAFKKTIVFFRRHPRSGVDINKIASQIFQLAPIGDRYEILELLCQAARSEDLVCEDDLKLLKNISDRFDASPQKFRAMIEKIFPANLCEIENVELIFGITSDMDKEQAFHVLNKEYQKWNARVTNHDPAIQNQAERMLKIIAKTRKQFALNCL